MRADHAQMAKIQRKRQHFVKHIRSHHRQQIKQKLRESAILNFNIAMMLDDLPSTFSELIQLILHENAKSSTNSSQLFDLIQAHEQSIISNNNISHHKHVVFFIFLLKQFPDFSQRVFSKFFMHLIRYKNPDELSQVFVPVKMMLKKDPLNISKYARLLLDKVEDTSFTMIQLQFYRYCLLNLGSRDIIHDLVRKQIVYKISQHFSYSYYTSGQKIKMMEIIILAMHKIKDIKIGDSNHLKKIYKTLKSYIFENPLSLQKQSKFIETSLNLIYDLIIHQQNQDTQFIHCQLFTIIQDQLCNQSICLTFKRPMAKTYIVAILDSLLFTKAKYIQDNTKIFLENVRYLIDIFTQDRQIMSLIIDLLRAFAVQFQSTTQAEPILVLIEKTESISNLDNVASDILSHDQKQI